MCALVAGYARHAVVDSGQFANRATAGLEDDAVRALIATRVADEVLRQEPDLIAVRPLIESVAAGVVGSGAFTGVFRSAVRDVHRALVERDEDTLTLTLRDIGVVLAGAVQAVRPELADELRRADDVSLLTSGTGPVSADLIRVAERIRIVAWLLLLAARRVRRRGRSRSPATAAPRRSRSAAPPPSRGSCSSSSWRSAAGRRSGRSTARRRATPPRPCGMPSSAGCETRPGCSPDRARSSRPRRRPCCGRSTSRRWCAAPRAWSSPSRPGPACGSCARARWSATGLALLLAPGAVLASRWGIAGVLLIGGRDERAAPDGGTAHARAASGRRRERRRGARALAAAAVATVLVGAAVGAFAGSGGGHGLRTAGRSLQRPRRALRPAR